MTARTPLPLHSESARPLSQALDQAHHCQGVRPLPLPLPLRSFATGLDPAVRAGRPQTASPARQESAPLEPAQPETSGSAFPARSAATSPGSLPVTPADGESSVALGFQHRHRWLTHWPIGSPLSGPSSPRNRRQHYFPQSSGRIQHPTSPATTPHFDTVPQFPAEPHQAQKSQSISPQSTRARTP